MSEPRPTGFCLRQAAAKLRPEFLTKLPSELAPLEQGTVEARLQAIERQIASLPVHATRDGAKRLRHVLDERDRLRAEAGEGKQ